MELLEAKKSDLESRAHSCFPASGAERWHICAYSAEHEDEFPESADSFFSKEGTLAHSILEAMLKNEPWAEHFDITDEMIGHVRKVADEIKRLHAMYGGALLVEKRVYAEFLHEEMFGTCDAIQAGNKSIHGWRPLLISDLKYGMTPVKPERNKQLIQYALSVAEAYDWDFTEVQMRIFQPRVRGGMGAPWIITIDELKSYIPVWREAVARVEAGGNVPVPGSHCHWCRGRQVAKGKLSCPAKEEHRTQKISTMFKNNPLQSEVQNGFKKESGQTAGQAFFGEEIETEVPFGEGEKIGGFFGEETEEKSQEQSDEEIGDFY